MARLSEQGRAGDRGNSIMRQRTPFRRIGVVEATPLLERGDLLLLDVRDAGSFETAHIDNARPISSANLASVINATSKSRPILVYCYHGNASQEVAQTFSDFGFAEVYSLDGGFEAWRTRPLASVAPPPRTKLAIADSIVPRTRGSRRSAASNTFQPSPS